MNKYFIQFNGSAGNLAVEKHLYINIRDEYEHTIVPECAIKSIVEHLQLMQDNYLLYHKGKKVTIEAHPSGVNGNYFLNAGSICLVLILIQHEY